MTALEWVVFFGASALVGGGVAWIICHLVWR
jgi:hypothetical protein